MTTLSSAIALEQGLLRLDDWGLIRASGPDARSFLQSQLTQDMHCASGARAALAGWCSAKGRLLASFVVWASDTDEWLLACSADLLEATLERLSMFVLRAKCRLSDASADFELWGQLGSAAAGVVEWAVQFGDRGWAIELPAARIDDQVLARRLLVRRRGLATPQGPTIDAGVWRAFEAASGVARIVAATREQFVPQMVNLELVGGVNFKKGCYPGQEVVARSQYRGTLKRRAFVLQGSAEMSPGQEVFHSEDPAQPAGMVVNAGRLDDQRFLALVELKIAAADGAGSLHLAAPDGPLLERQALPYEVPREAA